MRGRKSRSIFGEHVMNTLFGSSGWLLSRVVDDILALGTRRTRQRSFSSLIHPADLDNLLPTTDVDEM